MRALVFDLRYIGQEDIIVVYHIKILKTRRRNDLRSCRARKDKAVVSKHHRSSDLSSDFIFFFPSLRTGNSNRNHVIDYPSPCYMSDLNASMSLIHSLLINHNYMMAKQTNWILMIVETDDFA